MTHKACPQPESRFTDSLFINLPTALAVSPPIPASTSSKICVRDSPAAVVATLMARLILDSLNEGGSEKEIDERENCIEELQFIEEDIRKISHNLSTQLFSSNTNFVNMVEELVEKQSKISNFDYEVEFEDGINWEVISNKIKIHCYRTFQEALQNINKYAKASKVKIAITKISGKLLIEIKDNGVGFVVKKKSKGIGIKNIKSRVERLYGNVKFVSSINNGTLIKMSIPLT